MMRALSACLLFLPAVATAAVHHVPSQYATIQAGIDACAEGDTVLVAPGSYAGPGNCALDFQGTNLFLCSIAGPAATVINCQGESRGFSFHSGESSASRLKGFTVERPGGQVEGAGLYCVNASPTFVDVVIRGGEVGGVVATGAGAYFRNSNSRLERVHFLANDAYGIGFSGDLTWGLGGGIYAQDSQLSIVNCAFAQNRAVASDGWSCCSEASGAAIYVDGGEVRIERSLFIGNTCLHGGLAYSYGGAVFLYGVAAAISNCTFVSNRADNGGAIYATSPDLTQLSNSIFTGNMGGLAVPSALLVTCSNFWLNTGSDQPHLGQNGNFYGDPRFCNWGTGDFRLDPNSPCLPAHNACGILIGALGQGCEETPVMLASFTVTPAAGAVDLAWEADALADFRLTGMRATTTWDVAWQAAGSGRFHARDENPQLAPGGEVSYRLEGRLPGEDWQLLRELAVTLPPAFATRLLEPHPNPFNPTVTLAFTLAAPGRVRLEVFDLAGRRIATLANGHFEAGKQALSWNGRDGAGNPQASGVYFVRLAATGYTETKRLILLR